MAYTRDYILDECKKAMANPSTFYQQPFVNYRGKTVKGELYNEIVAEFVCKHFDDLSNGINTITRESYKTDSHDGVIKSDHEDSRREEEHIAVAIYNQGKEEKLNYVGEMIDYQTPLKNKINKENKGVGKIDLLSYNKETETLYILELKKPDSKETMLRCVLEGFSYLKIVDGEKLLDSFKLPPNTRIVACPFVFWGRSQNNEMNEDRPWLKKVMDLLDSKPYYIKEENGKYFVTDKGKQKLKKDLNKLLDKAIMEAETTDNSELKSGYIVLGKDKPYDNYIDNKCWDEFKTKMKNDYPIAFAMYGQGGGKELDERKVGKYIYPPKMASFGSSSRMIFNLLKGKEKEGFRFEQKLRTTVGGTANLDGFMMTDKKCVFVEAKCREPYTAKDSLINVKYKDLYKFISASSETDLVCRFPGSPIAKTDENNMEVIFMAGETEIQYFDIKQMICHLLGIATAYLKGKIDDKEINSQSIEFVYLLFNPTLINLNEGKEDIHRIYKQTCEECETIDFKALFEVIVDYLRTVKGIGKDKNRADIINGFSFRLCDQNNINI